MVVVLASKLDDENEAGNRLRGACCGTAAVVVVVAVSGAKAAARLEVEEAGAIVDVGRSEGSEVKLGADVWPVSGGSTSRLGGSTLGKMAGLGAPFWPVVRTRLMRKQAMLNSFLSSLPSLLRSARFQITPRTLVGRPDFMKKFLACSP